MMQICKLFDQYDIFTLLQVRDKMVLETILDIEFQDMVAGDKAIFYQVSNITTIVRITFYQH